MLHIHSDLCIFVCATDKQLTANVQICIHVFISSSVILVTSAHIINIETEDYLRQVGNRLARVYLPVCLSVCNLTTRVWVRILQHWGKAPSQQCILQGVEFCTLGFC